MLDKSIGIFIGRFQFPELTDNLKEVFKDFIKKGHDKNIIVIGISPLHATKKNPFDFDSRRRMIEDAFPNQFQIMYIKDQQDDKSWSESLDFLIDGINNKINHNNSINNAVIYGTRENVVNRYTGHYKCNILQSKIISVATSLNFMKGSHIEDSKDWKLGVLWAIYNRYTTNYMATDCIIFSASEKNSIYLIKKLNENGLRFPGGFTQSMDNSLEDTALREAKEETGLNCTNVKYIGSAKIHDWRYKNEFESITTSIFVMNEKDGTLLPGNGNNDEDISELHCINLKDLKPEMLIEEHRIILDKLFNYLKN